jgi:mannose-6-phosphate isomerase-like protein (cupin superfamily)
MMEQTGTDGGAMIGWVGNIEQETNANETFRTVVFTGEHAQLTVMSIPPGEDIGWEVHGENDQFLRIEQGDGRLELGASEGAPAETHAVGDDWAMVIPAGTWHNVVNTGTEALKLYSLYSPPHHPDGTVHETKADAEAAEH